ncbi:mitochondrial inner membrane protein domain-containing protein [Phthorimaea operculella]|nr:mitochondrial inner membrane protein domain-containing protein [Phthorimaea operculella]
MYRFLTRLSQSHLVLVRKNLGDGSCAALVVVRAPARQYALQQGKQSPDHYQEVCPEVEPVKKKSRKFLFGLIGATIAIGAGCVYAKENQNVRNWLQNNAPWADNFVAVVYQEKMSYLDFTVDKAGKLSTAVTGFLFGKEGVEPMEFQQQAEQDLDKDAKKGFQPKSYKSTVVQTEKCDPAEPPKVEVPKDAVEHEKNMHKYTRIAIDNYKQAIKLTHDYNKMIDKIINCTPPAPHLFTALKGLRTEKDKVIKEATDAAAKAMCSLTSLDNMIKENSIVAPPERLTQTKRFITALRTDLDKAETEYKTEAAKGELTDKYWQKIEAARTMFMNELQALFPNVDLCANKLDVQGDIDLFILYCVNQIQLLQNGIAEMQTILEAKINKAIECMDDKTIIEAKVQELVMKERLAKEIEFQKKTLRLQAEELKRHRQELHKQFEMQEKIAQQKIAKIEAETNTKANKKASEEIEKERVKFKKELAAIAGKLKALEQTLKQRAAAEQEARRAQSIWAAAEALLQATRRGTTRTSVDNELKALEKAGEKDKLVQTVLKAIPADVKQQGIITEKALKDRFDVLADTAVKVALVGKNGSSLPVYFLSWVQSKILFTKFAEIPQNELDNMPTDFTKLDTFDIIHRARYHMEHGNLPAALRYVNLLQGAPRAAAACWLQAARTHLEVKQAAETVMAHASLATMLYS